MGYPNLILVLDLEITNGKVFNKLTNNGFGQDLYLDNGQYLRR